VANLRATPQEFNGPGGQALKARFTDDVTGSTIWNSIDFCEGMFVIGESSLK
jgi:hypothetical protein